MTIVVIPQYYLKIQRVCVIPINAIFMPYGRNCRLETSIKRFCNIFWMEVLDPIEMNNQMKYNYDW